MCLFLLACLHTLQLPSALLCLYLHTLWHEPLAQSLNAYILSPKSRPRLLLSVNKRNPVVVGASLPGSTGAPRSCSRVHQWWPAPIWDPLTASGGT